MYYPDNDQRYTYKPFQYAGAENRTAEKKVGIPHLSHTKLLTSMQTKAVIEPLHAQILNDIAFVVVSPFSPFGCKMARVAVLASCGFAMFSNTPPF